jgi:hypothetical protein
MAAIIANLSVATTLPIITLAAFWPVGLLFKKFNRIPDI